jgi:hypothetical protein
VAKTQWVSYSLVRHTLLLFVQVEGAVEEAEITLITQRPTTPLQSAVRTLDSGHIGNLNPQDCED